MFFHEPATPEIYTLSLHDVFRSSRSSGELATSSIVSWNLESCVAVVLPTSGMASAKNQRESGMVRARSIARSEEHTSELQSLTNLVCRLLLEKKRESKYRHW